MKYLLPLLLLLFACNDRKNVAAPDTDQNDNATLTKENAEERLKALRNSIKDSAFAIITDANLAITRAEFKLQQNDSSRLKKGITDSVLVNHTAGKNLYTCMQRAYELSLAHASRPADIIYYKEQLLIPEKQWLSTAFAGKKTYEGLIALHRLQKDMLIVSMVVNDADTDEGRLRADEQYSRIEEIMKKEPGQPK